MSEPTWGLLDELAAFKAWLRDYDERDWRSCAGTEGQPKPFGWSKVERHSAWLAWQGRSAEIERLRAALEQIRTENFAHIMKQIAREALEFANCTCPEVCKICGGRASACKILWHRPESQRSVKWHECVPWSITLPWASRLPDKLYVGKVPRRDGCTCYRAVRRGMGYVFRRWVLNKQCPVHGYGDEPDFWYMGT